MPFESVQQGSRLPHFVIATEIDEVAAVHCSVLHCVSKLLTGSSSETKTAAHCRPGLFIHYTQSTDFNFQRIYCPRTASTCRVPQVRGEWGVLCLLLKVPRLHVLCPWTGEFYPDHCFCRGRPNNSIWARALPTHDCYLRREREMVGFSVGLALGQA